MAHHQANQIGIGVVVTQTVKVLSDLLSVKILQTLLQRIVSATS